jgi:hypothetical protein
MSPAVPAGSGFPFSSVPSPTSSLPPHPAHAATGGWPAPGDQRLDVPGFGGPGQGGPGQGGPGQGGPGQGGPPQGDRRRRSRAAFVAMVVLACAALFALSLLITVLLLR